MLEGVSVGKPEKGKGKNRLGRFSSGGSPLKVSTIKLWFLQLPSKATEDILGCVGTRSSQKENASLDIR